MMFELVNLFIMMKKEKDAGEIYFDYRMIIK